MCDRRDICDTYKCDDNTYTDTVDTTLVRYHTRLLCVLAVPVLLKIR